MNGKCIGALVAVLTLASFALAQENKPAQPPAAAAKTIVDVAKDTANLKTFHQLVEKAGLVDQLKGKGPFTVFAPTDEAFAKLGKEKLDDLMKPENKEKLAKILKHHVAAEMKMQGELEKAKHVKTLDGATLNFTAKDGKVMVEKANIVKGDIKADNGVIHTVDAVIMAE